jgi:hypothetical protein
MQDTRAESISSKVRIARKACAAALSCAHIDDVHDAIEAAFALRNPRKWRCVESESRILATKIFLHNRAEASITARQECRFERIDVPDSQGAHQARPIRRMPLRRFGDA